MLLADECIEMGCPPPCALLASRRYKGIGDDLWTSSASGECERDNCILWIRERCRSVWEARLSSVPVMGEQFLDHNCMQPKWVP